MTLQYSVSNKIVLFFVYTSLSFRNESLSIAMRLRISVARFSSSLKTHFFCYFSYFPCLILISPICNSHVGLVLFHTIIYSLFLKLILISFLSIAALISLPSVGLPIINLDRVLMQVL